MSLIDKVPDALRILTPNLDRLVHEFGHTHFIYIEKLLTDFPEAVDIPDVQKEFLELLLYITGTSRRSRQDASLYMTKRALEYVGMKEIQTLKDVASFHCQSMIRGWSPSSISRSSESAIVSFTSMCVARA